MGKETSDLPEEAKKEESVSKSVKIDLAMRLPVLSRLRKRLQELHVLSRAKITKVPMGNTHYFETEPPKMFISNLSATIKGDVGIISYQKYKVNKDGNKVAEVTKREVNGVMVEVDAHYVIDKLVVERIVYMKPIKIEEVSYEPVE